MKKIIAILSSILLVFSLVGCTKTTQVNTGTDTLIKNVKVGMICIGNENMAYDRNFYHAAESATNLLKKKGINVEWLYTYDHPEGDPVAADCEELADAGCSIVFLNSYGQEPAMLTVAADHPEVTFVGCTNESSKSDDLDNTVNAFTNIYEGRYLAGVAAGCKLNEMIENNIITPEEAVMGYVGAYTYSEVISGYTAFYLGAKSICPTVTMMVEFIGSWGDPTLEAATAQDLIDRGAVLISQHSDSTTPSTTAQSNGVYSVGYNIDMSDVAPEAAIISSYVDWTNYFVYAIETVANGEKVGQDYLGHGFKDGDVKLTNINSKAAASNTKEVCESVLADIIEGKIQVFDTSTFTVNGEELTTSLVDMNADFIPDEGYDAVFDGAYHESYFKSAPAFSERIDGIILINEIF